ncbi:MAG: hypothetical protein WKH64_02345 [Chloroflexia bacterium]
METHAPPSENAGGDTGAAAGPPSTDGRGDDEERTAPASERENVGPAPLLDAVMLGVLALCVGYAARPWLHSAAEWYYERGLPLRGAAGWYYQYTNHPPIFALGCALVLPTLYLTVRAVRDRQ